MIEILNGTLETVNYKDQSSILLHLNTETEDYPLHRHMATEIIMPMENVYTVEVGDKRQTIRPCEIIIIPSGELHQIYASDYGKRIIMLVDSSLQHFFPEFNFILQMMHPFMYISFDSDEEIRKKLCMFIEKITKEYFSNSPFREASCYSLLIEFFVTLGNIYWPAEWNGTSKKRSFYIERVLVVCHYINVHCTENITIDKMAEIAGFSKFHFCRIFKEHMNMSCYSYLIKRRLIYAEKLLTDKNCSVTQAALQSGFNSLSTFNRVFRAQKHCTPTEFKSLNRINH